MNVTEAMQKIEELRFSALTNLASEFRTFVHILTDQEEVKVLSGLMKSPQVTASVFERLIPLTRSALEEAYEHPADTAMAAYLWLLGQQPHDCLETATEAVLGCKQSWWSRPMAEHVRAIAASAVDSGSRQRTPVGSVAETNGTRPREELQTDITPATKKIKPGEVSEPV
jgi:hypothetical protein